MQRGGDPVHPVAAAPRLGPPRQAVQAFHQPLRRQLGDRPHRVREVRAEQFERVAGAEDVIHRDVVVEGRGGPPELRHQTRLRILEGAQPLHHRVTVLTGRGAAQQQIRDLHRVAHGSHRRGGPGTVGPGTVRTAAFQYLTRLLPGTPREAFQPGVEAARRRPGRRRRTRARRCGVPPVAQAARRAARRHRPGRQVLRDDRARPDDTVVADGDPVHDDGVRADPDVVAEHDALRDEGLTMDRLGRGETVVEAEQRGVCPHPHTVTHHDLAACRGERVERAVAAHDDLVGDHGVRPDVRAVPEPQGVGVDPRPRRHEHPVTELRRAPVRLETPHERRLVGQLGGPLLLVAPAPELPRAVVVPPGARLTVRRTHRSPSPSRSPPRARRCRPPRDA